MSSFKCLNLINECRLGNINEVKRLLDEGADINCNYPKQNNYPDSPIYIAITFNYPHIVKLLLERGADIYKPVVRPNYSYSNMLHYALFRDINNRNPTDLDRSEIIKLICKHDPKIINSKIDNSTPLEYSIQTYYNKYIETLLDCGAIISKDLIKWIEKNPYGNTKKYLKPLFKEKHLFRSILNNMQVPVKDKEGNQIYNKNEPVFRNIGSLSDSVFPLADEFYYEVKRPSLASPSDKSKKQKLTHSLDQESESMIDDSMFLTPPGTPPGTPPHPPGGGFAGGQKHQSKKRKSKKRVRKSRNAKN